MQMASSANRTCSELRSASLYIATALMPNSLQAQITRRAISPRFAMRIFLNMKSVVRAFAWILNVRVLEGYRKLTTEARRSRRKLDRNQNLRVLCVSVVNDFLSGLQPAKHLRFLSFTTNCFFQPLPPRRYAVLIPNSGIPYSTGLPLGTNILAITPDTSASISFISFMASMMHSTCPSFTASPTLTKGGVPGDGAS